MLKILTLVSSTTFRKHIFLLNSLFGPRSRTLTQKISRTLIKKTNLKVMGFFSLVLGMSFHIVLMNERLVESLAGKAKALPQKCIK